MNYTMKIETFYGEVQTVILPSKGAVAQFITEYPKLLPVGISVRVSCDLMSLNGVLRGSRK